MSVALRSRFVTRHESSAEVHETRKQLGFSREQRPCARYPATHKA